MTHLISLFVVVDISFHFHHFFTTNLKILFRLDSPELIRPLTSFNFHSWPYILILTSIFIKSYPFLSLLNSFIKSQVFDRMTQLYENYSFNFL